MQGVGPKSAKIMVVGQNPGRNEDLKGIPFIGESGTLLRQTLHMWGVDPEECYITNAVKCYTQDNETPTSFQILSCFSKLEQEILEVQPKIILLTGAVPLESVLGTDAITKYRGWLIPYQKYQTILLPTIHPSFVLRDKLANMPCFAGDIKKLKRFKPFEEYDLNDYRDNHEVLSTVKEIEDKILSRVRNGERYAFDIETVGGDKDNPKNGVKPYYNNSRILICGVAFSGTHSYSFPINEQTLPCLKELYSSPTHKTAHNIKFEQIWGIVKATAPEIDLNTADDTMLLSYALDERNGIHSLDFQLFVRLGLHKMEGTEQYKKCMDECPEDLLHKYCGVDCKGTFRLRDILVEEIDKYPAIKNVYRNILLEGALATNRMEMEGLIVDWNRIKNIDTEYENKISSTIKELYSLPKVLKFKHKYGKFNFKSPKDIIQYVIDNFGNRVLGITKKENYSVDATVLKFLAEKGDKFSELLLEFRDLSKAKSTYTHGMYGFKYDDDKLHADYNMHGTQTGRLSSNSPNLQNIDKRKHKEIRTIFVPPKDHVILSADYSGAEICGITMASGDELLAKEIREGVNIHGKWTKILYDLPDDNINWHEPKYEELRYKGKNKFFFPSCYGAFHGNIADSIELPKHKVQAVQERFFEEYNGLHKYHENVVAEYKKFGYVTTFFGRRRRAPLAYNQIINTPIQSLMGDFTTLSLIVLTKMGYRIPLDVHDDLTFYIKSDIIKEAYEEIRSVMIGWKFPFMNVPLEIEASIGEDWGSMEEYKP
jgi:uracil-DNA glycosylase family 4